MQLRSCDTGLLLWKLSTTSECVDFLWTEVSDVPVDRQWINMSRKGKLLSFSLTRVNWISGRALLNAMWKSESLFTGSSIIAPTISSESGLNRLHNSNAGYLKTYQSRVLPSARSLRQTNIWFNSLGHIRIIGTKRCFSFTYRLGKQLVSRTLPFIFIIYLFLWNWIQWFLSPKKEPLYFYKLWQPYHWLRPQIP